MKKYITIVIIAVCMLCMCSCDIERKGYTRSYSKGDITVTNSTEYNGMDSEYIIKDITYNGETHEYIEFHGSHWFGLSHWAGCKYCRNSER